MDARKKLILYTHFEVIAQFNVSIIHKHLEDYYYEFYFDNPNFMVNVHEQSYGLNKIQQQ